jgi:hypothetical protein
MREFFSEVNSIFYFLNFNKKDSMFVLIILEKQIAELFLFSQISSIFLRDEIKSNLRSSSLIFFENKLYTHAKRKIIKCKANRGRVYKMKKTILKVITLESLFLDCLRL